MRTLVPFVIFLLFGISVYSQRVVVFYTSMGNFKVEIDTVKTPITGGNFLSLVREGYYDRVTFHRVIDNFMIQGGRGATTKPTIQDEFDSTLSNVKGTISMANTGAPNSGTSQFFINLVDNTRLDFDKPPFTSKHPVFGHVLEGFSVVEAIGKVSTDGSDKPIVDVVMDSLRVVPLAPPASVVSSLSQSQTVSVYPNPIVPDSRLSLVGVADQVEIELIDATGKLHSRSSYHNVETVQMNELLNDQAPKGLYFIRVSTDKGTEVIRVVVP